MAYSGPLQLAVLEQEAAAAPPHPWQWVLFDHEEQGPHFLFSTTSGELITGVGTTVSCSIGAATTGNEK